MHRNSVTNYAKLGEVPSHLAVIAALLGAMADKKVDFRSILDSIEIEPKKPRGGASKGTIWRQQASRFADGVMPC